MTFEDSFSVDTTLSGIVAAQLDSMEFRALNPEQVLDLRERLLADARRAGDPAVLAEALLWLHRFVVQYGAPGSAPAARQEARVLCDRTGDKPGLALCDVWDAEAAIAQGHYAEAVMMLRRALPALAAHRNPARHRLDGLYALAYAFHSMAMYEAAVQAAEAMMPLAASIGDAYLLRAAKLIRLTCLAGSASQPKDGKVDPSTHDQRMHTVIDALYGQIAADLRSAVGAQFDARYMLFQVLIGMGRDSEAVAMWKERPELRPPLAMPGAEGLLALYLDGPQRAIDLLLPWTRDSKALPVDGRRDVWQSLCLAHEAQGDYKAALHAAHEANHLGQQQSRQVAGFQISLIGLELELEREHALAQRALVHAGKLAAVGQLASSMAHEISQPAGALMLLCTEGRESLENQRLEDAARCLGDMERQIDRVRRLIMRMKDFSRDDPIEIKDLALGQVVEEASRLVGPALRACSMVLEVDVPDLVVVADKESIVLSLVNLVNNAVDAMRDQSMPPPQLRIQAQLEPGAREVLLMVVDNGPGLSQQVMNLVFTPFFTTKPSSHGLGLGLTITRQALMRMGASLDVQNEPGRGARFTLRLPASAY